LYTTDITANKGTMSAPFILGAGN